MEMVMASKKCTVALSICSNKIIFVQDKMKIVLDKIIFVQVKNFCPKLESHFSYNSSLMMNFLSMYKMFCSGDNFDFVQDKNHFVWTDGLGIDNYFNFHVSLYYPSHSGVPTTWLKGVQLPFG